MSQPIVENNDVALESVETADLAVETPSYSKQSLNVYTVMLVIAFVCLITAIILLTVELGKWDGLPFPYKTNTAKPTPNWITQPIWFR